MNQNYNSLSGSMPSSYQFFTVNPTDSNNTIAVRLIDIENGTSTAVSAISGNIFQIPADLTVGTYNFEVTETDSSGNVSVFAYTFLFHTSATIFGNASSETVCVGEEVTFSVDISNLGIGSNYMGSYYVINFGDGSSPLIYTQAELLDLYTDPVDPITHVFDQPSCSANGNNSFIVSKKLYNKGLVDTGNNPQCGTYVQNGLGASKEIATAESPEAKFNLNPEQCISEDIEAINNKFFKMTGNKQKWKIDRRKDGKIDINMEDDVIRGMTVVKDGSITYPPPKIEVSVSPKQEEKKAEPIVKPAENKGSLMPAVIALTSLFLVGAFAPASFMNHFTVFVLSCFVGYMVIWNVTASLHTPLMSVTNAVSSIIIIGAITQISTSDTVSLVLACIAIFIASINIFGGFAVTKRMLGMFKK
mgnify:CR=1 FL=1